jgi:cytochrome P450 PksS
MTTTQEMASRVLKGSQLFTLRKDDGAVAGLRWWMPSIFRVFTKNMLTVDEPDHTRLRGIVEEAFRRRAVLDMAPRIRAVADQLADELFVQGRPADLVARYARILPLSVICELLGLPLADRPRFIAWTSRATGASSALVFLRMVPTMAAIKRYLEQRLEYARKVGGEGLIAELVRVEKEGAQISREEMVVMVFLLLFAGHETTTHLISGSVFELGRNPELRDHMDPAANASPEKLDLARRPNRHIAFGTGIHSALVISSRAWKANVRSRLCTRAGLNSASRSSPHKCGGAAGPALGLSSACPLYRRENDY